MNKQTDLRGTLGLYRFYQLYLYLFEEDRVWRPFGPVLYYKGLCQ